MSVALERRPELFPQARGKLHWEKTKPKRQKRLRSHRPLQRILDEYVEENKDELEAEAARRHALARKGLLGDRVTSWPATKTQWLRWLEREQATYDTALQSVKAGVRRAVNVRVTPHPNVPQKDPAVRIKPQTDTARPPWAGRLHNGWYALRLQDTGVRLVMFVVRCAGKLAAFARALASLAMPP